MSNVRAASRYAKALIDLSVERKEIDQVKSDLDLIATTLRNNREFRVFMASPVIKPAQKKKIVKEIFSSSVSETAVLFLSLLIDHGRETITAEVIARFVTLYLQVKGITRARVTVASELPEELKDRFGELVRQIANGGEVLLEERINPEIIGGYVLRVNDRQVDASISGRLHKLQQQYSNNPYVADF